MYIVEVKQFISLSKFGILILQSKMKNISSK